MLLLFVSCMVKGQFEARSGQGSAAVHAAEPVQLQQWGKWEESSGDTPLEAICPIQETAKYT